ncbi:hypothetical protein Tco_0532668 [Tanacetum coccineum]
MLRKGLDFSKESIKRDGGKNRLMKVVRSSSHILIVPSLSSSSHVFTSPSKLVTFNGKLIAVSSNGNCGKRELERQLRSAATWVHHRCDRNFEEYQVSDENNLDWKTYTLTENFMYYQIFRGDGSSKNYKVLSEMLEDFDRQDVEELYRLVKERYSASRPEGYDLMLWGDLHTLFEPDEEDEIWKNQHEYNVISWSLYDFCGIHILLMQNGIAIHMLTEKKYPLSQEMISKMLKKKLEVDHESSQAFELLSTNGVSTASTNLVLPELVNTARRKINTADGRSC